MAQQPVGRYNVDLAVAPVAVEVWWSKAFPFRYTRQRRRVVDLADLGWWTCLVWLSEQAPNKATADAVVAAVKKARRAPLTVRPQYWVVRGDGEIVAAGEAKMDELTLEPPSSARA